MKKAVWGAFVLMTAFAATGLCEMDYTLTNPHIRYEKIEGAQQAEEAAQTDGAGISLSEMAAAQDVQQQEHHEKRDERYAHKGDFTRSRHFQLPP